MSVLISIKDADALNDNADLRWGLMVMCPSRQFRQLGDVGGDASRLVLGEQLGRRAASRFLLEIGEHLPLVSTSMKHAGCCGDDCKSEAVRD